MAGYDNRGNVSLWKNNSDNPKAPNAHGTVVAHRDIKEGEEISIALWRNDSDNPKAPTMTGKISDKRQGSGQGGGQAQPATQAQDYGDFNDDEPPF